MTLESIRALLRDGRRSQRGSVLSGVLLITAFVAILSGALMSGVSTNFLISRTLVNRVNNQATVNSAMEMALSQMGASPVYNGCPSLPPVTLNGVTAAASYSTCAASFDANTTPAFRRLPSAAASADGTLTSVGGNNAYLVGDSAGTLYNYTVGSSSPSWTVSLGGSVTGSPQAMPDGSTVLVPVTDPTWPAFPGCGPSETCVSVLHYLEPGVQCYLGASAQVKSRPAAGVNFNTVAFFGDQAGDVYAYDTYGASCSFQASAPGPAPVVAGPVVFQGQVSNQQRSDEVYFLASNGGATWLVHYTYTVTRKGAVSLQETAAMALPAPQALGLAANRSQLPVDLAITFTGGTVNLSSIASDYTMASLNTTSVPGPIVDAAGWCCGSSPTQIAVPQRRALYQFDSSLNLLAAYSLGGPSISAAPVADGGGDWFVAATDGNMYEVPAIQTTPTIVSFGQGAFGAAKSVELASCGNGWVCAYIASSTQNANFLVQLDARSAVLSACVSTAPPACSGGNPRLWVSVQVGAIASAQTVHVRGWSYYSP